jgi:hypothetical protein
VGRKGIVLLVLVVALAAVVGIALAARGDGAPKQPAFKPPAASKQFGDDADLMRRLERKKLTTRSAR